MTPWWPQVIGAQVTLTSHVMGPNRVARGISEYRVAPFGTALYLNIPSREHASKERQVKNIRSECKTFCWCTIKNRVLGDKKIHNIKNVLKELEQSWFVFAAFSFQYMFFCDCYFLMDRYKFQGMFFLDCYFVLKRGLFCIKIAH